MDVGVIQGLTPNLEDDFRKLKEYGFNSCQLSCWNESLMTDEYAKRICDIKDKLSIEITGFWCGWCKPVSWDFYEGPAISGLVPSAYRAARTETLIKGSDFAKRIATDNVITHVGFLPEDPNHAEYRGIVSAIKLIAKHCKDNGQNFLFETGQETPTALLRVIQDLGMENIGVNIDPANLLLYGKGNPNDALDIIGKYVMGVHGKDGEYPTDGRYLGEEKPLGKGRVNFPVFIEKLNDLGYKGSITIENEIADENQVKSILEAKDFLETIIQNL